MAFDKEMKDVEMQRVAHSLVLSMHIQTLDLVYSIDADEKKIRDLDNKKEYGKSFELIRDILSNLRVPPLYRSEWKDLALLSPTID
jgi:hypothetical protein